MRKLISALLLASMLISMAACGDSSDDGENADTSASDTATVDTDDGIINSGVEAQNFDREFNILASTFYDSSNWIYSDKNDGEIMAQELYKGRSRAEEKLGVKISVTADEGPYDLRRTFNTLMLSGDTTYQLLYSHDTCTVGNAINGDLQNIMNLEPYIDMDKPWWKGASEQFTIDGKLLFTSTCLDLSSIYLNCLLVYNKKLADENNVVIPYDDVIAGEWYMDDLIALTANLNRDTTGDTLIGENDQYGIATSKYPMMGLQSNMGGGILVNNDGVLEINSNMERIVGVLEKWEKLIENGTTDFGAVNGGGAELFINNQAVFMLGEARNLYTTVRQSDVVYGILPVPKYDETQEDYASAGCALYWGIPMTVPEEDLEFVGSVIQELSCYNYNYTVPAVWETILGGKLSESDEDAAMFEIIRGAQYVDLGFAFSAQTTALDNLVFMLENTTSDQAVSFFEARKPSVEMAINSLNSTYENLGE